MHTIGRILGSGISAAKTAAAEELAAEFAGEL
jgi:hypothetical protein